MHTPFLCLSVFTCCAHSRFLSLPTMWLIFINLTFASSIQETSLHSRAHKYRKASSRRRRGSASSVLLPSQTHACQRPVPNFSVTRCIATCYLLLMVHNALFSSLMMQNPLFFPLMMQNPLFSRLKQFLLEFPHITKQNKKGLKLGPIPRRMSRF